jgi:hypothetical protein
MGAKFDLAPCLAPVRCHITDRERGPEAGRPMSGSSVATCKSRLSTCSARTLCCWPRHRRRRMAAGRASDRPFVASTLCLYCRKGRGSRRPRRHLARSLRRRYRRRGTGSTGRSCRVAQPFRRFESSRSLAHGAGLRIRQDACNCVTRSIALDGLQVSRTGIVPNVRFAPDAVT